MYLIKKYLGKRMLFIIILFTTLTLNSNSQSLKLCETSSKDNFTLVNSDLSATIYVDSADFKVVSIAANDLSNDIERVTNIKPEVISYCRLIDSKNIVVIGTIGKSSLINTLIKNRKINVQSIQNKWEAYTIQIVKNPFKGIETALVIAGSDKRGTAYGTYSVSKTIGVSPWYWWADVPIKKRTNLFITANVTSDSPSVKYRGIFINDEMWGIREWASKTFAPEESVDYLGLGPKTYKKVFELMLRLKANYLWPAMHVNTKCFNFYPQNKLLADDYAIVMGSSHAEPMLRDNLDEWKFSEHDWNYETNGKNVLNYWEDRLKENGKFENIYTMGMRGIEDTSMPGGKNIRDKVNILHQVIFDQQSILKKWVKPNINEIPQLFCPYKEVLPLYQAGLKLPENITLLWTDDNHGYLRQLSTPSEQKRIGGSGVYWHLSYWGSPDEYLWLCSTPLQLAWEEMTKAYAYKADKIWVVNVGDIKPAEMETEFFLDMAWNIKPYLYNSNSANEFLLNWAEREFGTIFKTEIAEIKTEYYRLNYQIKPEHLSEEIFSIVNENDEGQIRLDAFEVLVRKTDSIYAILPDEHKNSFYQLIVYPVRCSYYMNQKFIYAQKSNFYARQGRASSIDFSEKCRNAYFSIVKETEYYNTLLSNGKWNKMMSMKPLNRPKFDIPLLPNFDYFENPIFESKFFHASSGLGISVEGSLKSFGRKKDTITIENSTLPTFNVLKNEKHFIDIFNKGGVPFEWKIIPQKEWIIVNKDSGKLGIEERIWVSIDWSKAPISNNIKGEILIKGMNKEYYVYVNAFNNKSIIPIGFSGFVEINGVISIEAEHFSNKNDVESVSWKILKGLGKSGSSIGVHPVSTENIRDFKQIDKVSPSISYNLFTLDTGYVDVTLQCLPTHRINANQALRYAIAIDNNQPIIVDYYAKEWSNEWAKNVVRAASFSNSQFQIKKAGIHTLKIWMIDPAVIIDKISINRDSRNYSYFGTKETYYNSYEL